MKAIDSLIISIETDIRMTETEVSRRQLGEEQQARVLQAHRNLLWRAKFHKRYATG